jgi:Trp operon repressor
MTGTPDFKSLLSMSTDSFEKPPALPAGHYRATIKGHKFDVSSQKQTPFVQFFFTPTEASEDVEDLEALAKINLSQRELGAKFYITLGAIWRLSQMLDAVLGASQGRSYDERIPETRGISVIIGVTQRENPKQEGEWFNDVTTITADE